jgi:hypothetical protein
MWTPSGALSRGTSRGSPPWGPMQGSTTGGAINCTPSGVSVPVFPSISPFQVVQYRFSTPSVPLQWAPSKTSVPLGPLQRASTRGPLQESIFRRSFPGVPFEGFSSRWSISWCPLLGLPLGCSCHRVPFRLCPPGAPPLETIQRVPSMFSPPARPIRCVPPSGLIPGFQ